MGFNPRGQVSTAAIVTYSAVTFYVQYLAARLVRGSLDVMLKCTAPGRQSGAQSASDKSRFRHQLTPSHERLKPKSDGFAVGVRNSPNLDGAPSRLTT
jgi:hypothetical protein